MKNFKRKLSGTIRSQHVVKHSVVTDDNVLYGDVIIFNNCVFMVVNIQQKWRWAKLFKIIQTF